MRRFRHSVTLALILVIVLVFVPAAFAHPLGNFTINHYAGLHVEPDTITIDYVLDMAEIAAFQEIDSIDANSNAQVDPEEISTYHPAQCEKISADLDLRLNSQRIPLTTISSTIEFPPGQAGLATLRLTCAFGAIMPSPMGEMRVTFENQSYSSRLGWREIVVTGEEVSLQGDFSTTSLSNRLVAYPQDLLSSPLDQRWVSFQVASSPITSQGRSDAKDAVSGQSLLDRNDAFTRLILLDKITLPTLLIAVAVSFLWGAMHAMTPGHGKTIVGAYLVGARGTAKHAFYLGLATTITHTAGVFALGLVTLFAARYVLPETLFPWLSFFSGLLVVGIGTNLFVSRLRASGSFSRLSQIGSNYPHHHHPDDAHHTHAHDHSYDHSQPHEHRHGQEHDLDHENGSALHSHLPPGADGAPVTWRSLLALGISGGLLPCPSALVVLLSAIALNRVGFGLVLVFAFSLGLAGVLTAIGILFVYAGRLFKRSPVQSRFIRLLPAASALFITLAGLGIAARALIETGLIEL